MSRPFRWILTVIATLLLIVSLCAIFINGKPLFDSSNKVCWIGFAIAFCILMVLLCYLNIKVGIMYTVMILLLLLIAWIQFRQTNEKNQAVSDTEQQLDENGNLILDHPYDDLISLQWGTLNNVDMDLMLIKQSDNSVINYNNPEHRVDDWNSVWLDYDYKMQEDVARKEIISILGMKKETFSVLVVKYNKEELKSDVVLELSLSNGNVKKYTLPAERFNDITNGIYVCNMIMQNNEIVEVMEDLDSNEIDQSI